MKKIKLTEKISERYDTALLCCFVIALIRFHLNGSRLAVHSALNGLTQTINKRTASPVMIRNRGLIYS